MNKLKICYCILHFSVFGLCIGPVILDYVITSLSFSAYCAGQYTGVPKPTFFVRL